MKICFTLLLICIPLRLSAQVTGTCANCHVMHNSQDGAPVAKTGDGVGWDGNGNLTGGSPQDEPQMNLLVTDCIGCHSSSTTSSIITTNGNRIPIVFNTAGPPVNGLAGGNFYWVANIGDAYGHNVRDISAQDGTLDIAPGSNFLQAGCGPSCHQSLTLPDYDNSGDYNNGCEGCHQSPKHHVGHPAGQPVPPDAGWYRFLSAPRGHMSGVGGGGVYGIEDPDWEANATDVKHNIYFGGDGNIPGPPDFFESISEFCAGCHIEFHSPGYPRFGIDNGGGANPWLRHPADAIIPDSGEFADGKVINTAYDPDVPVGKPDLTSFTSSLIENGDKVICLSCHRAHGSDQPDMLRWNYSDMIVGTEESAAGTGCFKCHTEKDGI